MSIFAIVLLCVLFTAVGSSITILFCINLIRRANVELLDTVDEKIKVSEEVTAEIICDRINMFVDDIDNINKSLLKNADVMEKSFTTLKTWLYSAVGRIRRGEHIPYSEISEPVKTEPKEVTPFEIVEDDPDVLTLIPDISVEEKQPD